MGSDKVGRDRSQKALEVKAYSFCLMLQKRASQWENAKQKKKKRGNIKKLQSGNIILPAAFRVIFRYNHDKRTFLKVRKEDVEMQNVKVLIGSWMGRNAI